MSRHPRPRSAPAAAGLVLGVLAATLPSALAAPSDPFSPALPARDARPPESQRAAGAAKVAEQMGTASYQVPIEVPPGRAGMVPSLALSYSSAGAVRGGLAVGWSLDLPIIERDPDFPAQVRYRTTLSGSSGRLIANTQDPGTMEHFRAEVDDRFVRYQRDTLSGWWSALAPDGHRYTFTQTSAWRWHLSEEVDPQGNAVKYFYETTTVAGFQDAALVRVEYTSNANAGLPAHAKVELSYAPVATCAGMPVGASVDYRFGAQRMSGSRRLDDIKVWVRNSPSSAWRLSRQTHLGYDAAELACSGSALRYLTQLDVTAYDIQGVATVAPPMRFGYGPRQRALARTITVAGMPREQGTLKGATSGFLDMDGDGRLDHVEMISDPRCTLRWRKGLADGQFAMTTTSVPLPSADWQVRGQRNPTYEYCTLSGQVATRPPTSSTKFCVPRGASVTYHFTDWDGDGRIDVLSEASGSACYMGGDYTVGVTCADNGTGTTNQGGCPDGATQIGTIEGKPNCTCNSGLRYDAASGGCQPACPSGQVYNVVRGACESVGCIATSCPLPGDPGNPAPDGPQCAGGAPVPAGPPFLWKLQRGSAGGIAPFSGAESLESPRPLPGGGATMGELQTPLNPQLPSIVDLDGDGYLDLVSLTQGANLVPPVAGRPGEYLYVWRGIAGGLGFQPMVRWRFPTAGWPQKAQGTTPTTVGTARQFTTRTTLALRDVNGDGAADFVVQQDLPGGEGPDVLGVAYNMPGGQGSAPADVIGAFSPIVSLDLTMPVEETRSDVTYYSSPTTWLEGARGHVRRLVDLDGDGTTELFLQSPGTSIAATASARVAYRLFGGARTMDWAALGTEWEPVEALLVATRDFVTPWKRTSDFVDVTGDGLPDAVTYDAFGNATIRTDAAGVPLRLLASIDNGRGGLTRFEYAWSSDPDAVQLVDATLAPRPVVRRVITSPGLGQPDQRTTYLYRRPVSGPNSPLDPGAPSFRGFTEVTIDSSGQAGDDAGRVVKTFDYGRLGSDWQGGLASELTSTKVGTAFVPVRHAEYQRAWGAVAGTAASATWIGVAISRTCAAGATAPSCAAQTTNRRITTYTRSPWAPLNGPIPQLYLDTLREDNDGVGTTRYEKYDHEKRWSATEALILTTLAERGGVVRIDTVTGPRTIYTPMAKTVTIYDTAARPYETRVYRDSTNYSTTRRYFDDQTGQVRREIAPNDIGVGTVWEDYTYDANRVQVISTTNRLGHLVTEGFDPATGARLWREGPNARTSPVCWFWCVAVPEREEWKVDGFGRILERRDSLDPAPGVDGYDLRAVEWRAYFDNEVPNRMVTTRLRDVATGATVVDEVRYDGAGRVITEVARRQESGQCDPETRYRYDAGGQVAQLDTPDPRVDTCATVTTSYARDGLGRVTALTRLDAATEVTTYAGLETTREERAADGTIGARTTIRTNAYGEEVEVREARDNLAAAPAVTTTTYDPLGRVSAVTDAEGMVTSFGHDWRGLRTSVTRSGGRIWTFQYDANGNQTSVFEPVPAGGVLYEYQSYTNYDALNRPIAYGPARYGMSAARRAELGLDPVYTTYDTNEGFIVHVGMPSVITLPFGTIVYAYDAQGRVIREQRTFTIAGLYLAQTMNRTYDVLGNLVRVVGNDGVEWRYTHDGRGAVKEVQWRDPATGTFTTLARYARNPAGVPRTRTSDLAPQQRDWHYDAQGRVTYDRVWSPATATTFHERSFGYDGFGELGAMSGITATLPVDVTYTYDRRHRLTHADGPLTYQAALTYSDTGNVATAQIGGALDAPARSVAYTYGAVDPQAVDRLTDTSTGAIVGAFSYDRAGNMTQRTVSGATSAFTFGGDGFLHEVVGPAGTERYLFAPGAERVAAIGPEGVKLWFGESETLYTTAGAQVRRSYHVAAGEPIARIDNGTQVELQYADALQNLALALDRLGVVKAAFVYGAFGEVVGAIDTGVHRRRFNGKEHDAVSGLRHYGYRSYDPATLRWASADPQYRFSPEEAGAEPRRANLYAFSLDNPVRYYDPDGRDGAAVRTWSRERSKNGTDWAIESNRATCPRKGTCEVDVIHQQRNVIDTRYWGAYTFVQTEVIQVRAAFTVIDGKVQQKARARLSVSVRTEVYRDGKQVAFDAKAQHGGLLDLTKYVSVDGNTVTVGVDAKLSTIYREYGSSVSMSGGVTAGAAVNSAPGANPFSSGGALGGDHSSSSSVRIPDNGYWQNDTSSIIQIHFVGERAWQRLATERVEGSMVDP